MVNKSINKRFIQIYKATKNNNNNNNEARAQCKISDNSSLAMMKQFNFCWQQFNFN